MRTTYEIDRTLQPIYSGGSIALSADGRILAASLGEDVLLTDLTNGKELGRAEGDGESITALACMFVISLAQHLLIESSDTIRIASDHMFAVAFYAHIRAQSL